MTKFRIYDKLKKELIYPENIEMEYMIDVRGNVYDIYFNSNYNTLALKVNNNLIINELKGKDYLGIPIYKGDVIYDKENNKCYLVEDYHITDGKFYYPIKNLYDYTVINNIYTTDEIDIKKINYGANDV